MREAIEKASDESRAKKKPLFFRYAGGRTSALHPLNQPRPPSPPLLSAGANSQLAIFYSQFRNDSPLIRTASARPLALPRRPPRKTSSLQRHSVPRRPFHLRPVLFFFVSCVLDGPHLFFFLILLFIYYYIRFNSVVSHPAWVSTASLHPYFLHLHTLCYVTS
jgi:hypothetical protein